MHGMIHVCGAIRIVEDPAGVMKEWLEISMQRYGCGSDHKCLFEAIWIT